MDTRVPHLGPQSIFLAGTLSNEHEHRGNLHSALTASHFSIDGWKSIPMRSHSVRRTACMMRVSSQEESTDLRVFKKAPSIDNDGRLALQQ